MRRLILATLAGALPAFMPVAAKACSIRAEAINFGLVDLFEGASARPRIQVQCPVPTDFTVGLSAPHSGGHRILFGPGSDVLYFQVYTSAGWEQIWGAGIEISPPVSASNDGIQPTILTLYAELYPKQTGVRPGIYSTQMTVTLNF